MEEDDGWLSKDLINRQRQKSRTPENRSCFSVISKPVSPLNFQLENLHPIDEQVNYKNFITFFSF
jgi:hypothetical protein